MIHCEKSWHLRLLMHPCTKTLITVVYTEKIVPIYTLFCCLFCNNSEYDNHILDHGRHTTLPRDFTQCSRLCPHPLGWFHRVYSNVIFSWFMSRGVRDSELPEIKSEHPDSGVWLIGYAERLHYGTLDLIHNHWLINHVVTRSYAYQWFQGCVCKVCKAHRLKVKWQTRSHWLLCRSTHSKILPQSRDQQSLCMLTSPKIL